MLLNANESRHDDCLISISATNSYPSRRDLSRCLSANNGIIRSFPLKNGLVMIIQSIIYVLECYGTLHNRASLRTKDRKGLGEKGTLFLVLMLTLLYVTLYFHVMISCIVISRHVSNWNSHPHNSRAVVLCVYHGMMSTGIMPLHWSIKKCPHLGQQEQVFSVCYSNYINNEEEGVDF